MAKVVPYKNKSGEIVSYQIQVSRGYDSSGKKLRPYIKSWKIPKTYKSEKAIQNALAKAIGEFEAECNRGEHLTDKRTFREYADYYLQLSIRDNKIKTSRRYKRDLVRVNKFIGDIRLTDLKASDINKMYLSMQEPGIRQDKKAVAKDPKTLQRMKAELGLLNKDFCAAGNIADNTLRLAMNGKHISIESAGKIAAVLKVKPDTIFEYITLGDDKSGLSAKTVRNYHNMIHVILQCAKDESVIRENPADSAKPPKVMKKEAEFFEIADILEIRSALEQIEPQFEKYKIMLYLLIDLGIRKGELTGICFEDIDFENRTITICHNIQYEEELGLYDDTPKNGKIRVVSMSGEVSKALKDFIVRTRQIMILLHGSEEMVKEINPKGYIFTQENGDKVMNPSSLNHWLIKFETEYNLPHIYPHKFRHSQASLLYASNIDMVTISKRLGHAQVSTTQNIYSHLMNGQDKKASDAVADLLYKKDSSV